MTKRLFVVLLFLLALSTGAGAEVTNWLNPGTAASVDRDNKTVWNNPENAIDASEATYSDNSLAVKDYSDWIRLTNFNFDSVLPANCTIDGIEVQIRCRTSKGGYVADEALYLRKTSGQVGDNKARNDSANVWLTSITTRAYGGSTDLWGTTWTRAEVASVDFGLDYSGWSNYSLPVYQYIYYVQVRIHYTPFAAGTFKVSGVANPNKVARVLNPTKVAGVETGAPPPPPPPPPGDNPEIYFVNTTASCNESDAIKNLEVRLSESSSSTVTVNWTAEGTNSYDGAQSSTYGSGADFSPASGQITFDPGQTSKNIILTIVNNTAAEPDQKLTVTLTEAINGTVDTSQDTCQLTIADNDRDCLLTMTSLPSTCPIGGCSGWGGSSWNLDGNDDNSKRTTNRDRFQALLNHFSTHHPGKALVCFFPYGTYRIDGNTPALNIPLSTNKVTFQGQSADGRVDGIQHTTLKAGVPYLNNFYWLFGNYDSYTYSGSNSGTNRFLLKNLVVDMDIENCGGDWRYYWGSADPATGIRYETTSAMQFNGATEIYAGPKLSCTMEKWRMKNTSGGLRMGYNTEYRLYKYRASDSLKGFLITSASEIRAYCYDITSDAAGGIIGGGLWMEPSYLSSMYPHAVWIYGDNWYVDKVQRWTICPGARGKFEVSNITQTPDTLGYVGNFRTDMFSSGHPSPHSSDGDWFYDSVFYVPGLNEFVWTGKYYARNCEYYCFTFPTNETARDMTCAPEITFNHDDFGCQTVYDNCKFGMYSKYAGYYAYAQRQYGGFRDWDSYQDRYIKFNNCMFLSSLDGVLRQQSQTGSVSYGGGLQIEFNDCIYQTNNNVPLFYLAPWSDNTNYHGKVTVNGGTFASNITKIYSFWMLSGTTSDKCWLFHNYNLTKAQAINSIEKRSGSGNLNVISVANAKTSAEVSAITKGSSVTTITTSTAHGLTTGDKVVFDGFSSSGNSSWFTNLSPHSNVPYFTATVLNSTQFTIPLNSSAYGNFSASADMARVSKYPFRTITGSAGDNPVSSKYAGLVGDRYNAGGTYYRCVTNGIAGEAAWVAE